MKTQEQLQYFLAATKSQLSSVSWFQFLSHENNGVVCSSKKLNFSLGDKDIQTSHDLAESQTCYINPLIILGCLKDRIEGEGKLFPKAFILS